LATRRGRRGGHVPNFDAETLAAAIDFVAGETPRSVRAFPVTSPPFTDVGAGGLATALAEMVRREPTGRRIVELEGHAELFLSSRAASS